MAVCILLALYAYNPSLAYATLTLDNPSMYSTQERYVPPPVPLLLADVFFVRWNGQVMADGPSAMEELQGDPETAELLKKLEEAMGGMQPQA